MPPAVRATDPPTTERESPVDIVLVGCSNQDNLSLPYLAAACDHAGYRAVITGAPAPDQLAALAPHIVELAPRTVGLSLSVQLWAEGFLNLASALRAAGFRGPLLAGGHFATLAYQELLQRVPPLDVIVLHEGEQTLVELLAALSHPDQPQDDAHLTGVAGIAVRDEDGAALATPARPLQAPDDIAWPARELPFEEVLGIPVATLIASRGCYGSCDYCSIHAWHRTARGPRYRQRSVADVVHEMAWLRTHHGVQIFVFNDDNFFLPSHAANLTRIEALADELSRQGIDDVVLSIKCRPSDIDDACLAALERIGLGRLFVGIDSASAPGLAALGRDLPPTDNYRALTTARSHGIHTAFNMLLFDPESTMESVVPNIDFLEAHADMPFNLGSVQVLPETALQRRLQAAGRLRGGFLGQRYALLDERAELMARIVEVALHHRCYHPEGVAQQCQAIGFEVEILRRLYDSPTAPELGRAVGELIIRATSSSVRVLREIHSLAASVSLTDDSAARERTGQTAMAVHREDFQLLSELRKLRTAVADATAAPPLLRQRQPEPQPPPRAVSLVERLPAPHASD